MTKERKAPSKRVIAALERIFAAEIDGRLPYQSKSRFFEKLHAKGLVAPMQMTFGGRFPITVHGWQLTHAGRLLYCSTC